MPWREWSIDIPRSIPVRSAIRYCLGTSSINSRFLWRSLSDRFTRSMRASFCFDMRTIPSYALWRTSSYWFTRVWSLVFSDSSIAIFSLSSMVRYSVRNKCRLWFRLDPIIVSNGRKSWEEVSLESVQEKIGEVLLKDHLWVRHILPEFFGRNVAVPEGCDVVDYESLHKC